MSDIYNAHNQARRAAVYEIGLAQDEWSINQAIRAVEEILYDTQVSWNKTLDQNSGWDLLNAGTDLLWHKENPTVTTYNQNAVIVDGLCRAVA